MSEISDRYRRLAATFTEKVAAVPADRWSSPSPCEGWSAREVVGHVVQTQGMFLGFVGREIGPLPSVDEDPVAAWEAARDVVQADLDDPARASAGFDGVLGPSTFEATVDRFGCMDLVIHGWDLSRAAGLDDRIDPAEVERVRGDAVALGDAIRSPGAFGPAVEPGEGADDQERLLVFLGRRA